MKKFLQIFFIVLSCTVGAIALVLISVHLVTPLVYSDFFLSSSTAYDIPGLADGFVQQGYTYSDEYGVFLHSGYMVDDTASRIYVVDGNDTENVKYVSLATADGQAYDAHSGGISTHGEYAWLAKSSGRDCLWRISIEDLLACENGDVFILDTPFYVDCNASFCHADDSFLWVGEFMDKGEGSDYEFNTSDGSVNAGLILGYNMEDAQLLADVAPSIAFSIPDTVQGMTTINDMIVLVTSSGINTSHLYFYDVTSDAAVVNTVELDGATVPVTILDQSKLTLDVSMQPMAEEIAVKDGSIYVSFESASLKYLFGYFTRGKHVYAYTPNTIK